MIEIKPTNVTNINENSLEQLIGQKTYREFVQLIVKNNKKGENGLIVKNLRESLSEIEEEAIDNEIELFNQKVENRKLWEMQTSEFFSVLDEKLQKYSEYDPSRKINYLLLFTMNYVFFCYANKSFRNFLGVKRKSLFKVF